jgi:glutamyl-tRNA synthetase
MGITHVIRGTEYLSSTPKYNLMYDAFGWERPVYIHLPPIMKDAQHKLSKRNGDASFQDLVDKGFLPEAILNYIALLGWNPGTEQEIFSLEELEKVFDANRLNKSPAIFDIQKLRWMNGCYIRALGGEEFHKLAEIQYNKFLKRNVNREELSKVLQPRVEVLNDIVEVAQFIEELPEYNDELFVNKKMKTDVEVAKKALALAYPVLEKLDVWTNESLFEALKAVAVENEMKNGQVLYPVRIALTGLETTPGGASEIASVLGKEETLRRLKLAM